MKKLKEIIIGYWGGTKINYMNNKTITTEEIEKGMRCLELQIEAIKKLMKELEKYLCYQKK